MRKITAGRSQLTTTAGQGTFKVVAPSTVGLGTSMIDFILTEPRINTVAVKANISEKEKKMI